MRSSCGSSWHGSSSHGKEQWKEQLKEEPIRIQDAKTVRIHASDFKVPISRIFHEKYT
jgi:hypothetical protein